MRTAITEENSPVWNPGLRIVQLDLARKMETPEFVKGYIDRVAAVGYDAVPCWWLKPDNARSFMAYARRHKVFGCCQTQWEGFFHGGALPNAVASAFLMEDPCGAGGEGATFARRFAFRSDAMPDAIRLEHHGYGEAQVRFVSVADRGARLVPKSVVETDGLVRDAENILVDDYSAATFGHSGYLDAFRDNALRDAVSSVTVGFRMEMP